jgi:nitroreductase
MPNPTFLQALDARRSVPSKQLSAPGPDDSTLLRMLTAAARVPDHGKLVPFRFLRISGDARHALGETLAARTLALDPNAPAAAVEKDRARFSAIKSPNRNSCSLPAACASPCCSRRRRWALARNG